MPNEKHGAYNDLRLSSTASFRSSFTKSRKQIFVLEDVLVGRLDSSRAARSVEGYSSLRRLLSMQ